MKASELIKALQEQIDKHGDCTVACTAWWLEPESVFWTDKSQLSGGPFIVISGYDENNK